LITHAFDYLDLTEGKAMLSFQHDKINTRRNASTKDGI